MTFANIKTADEFLLAVKNKPEIRNIQITDFEIPVMISSYIISDADTFNNLYAIEARGITFVGNEIACRPLHKFFNVNERANTQLNVLPWNTVSRVMIKEDGSIVNPLMIDGLIKMKSKKSFGSDTAIRATKYLHTQANYVEFVKYCFESKWTPTFEYIDLKNQIVLTYAKENLILTHVRENESGRYLNSDEIHKVAKWFDVEVVKELPLTDFNIQDYLVLAETLEGIEGWVFQFADGNMVKLKTKWYCDRHHVLTYLRERDIAELALNEQLDDLKSTLQERGLPLSEVEAIEHKVCSEMTSLVDYIEQKANEVESAIAKDVDRRDKKIYEYVSGMGVSHVFVPENKLRSMIMAQIKGKIVDYIRVYKEYQLSTFSLAQLNSILIKEIAETE